MAAGPGVLDRICQRCAGVVEPGVLLCPHCGVQLRSAAGGAGRRRVTSLVALGGVVVALALVITWRLAPGAASSCAGGREVVYDWRSDDRTAPRLTDVDSHQINPDITPHVKLATFRHTGNGIYGKKSDTELNHKHEPIAQALRAVGANAFYNEKARRLGDDRYEVATTAAVAHPGPVPAALRDRHLSNGHAILVVHVAPGGAAAAGGLQVNDVLVSMNGAALDGTQLHTYVAAVEAVGRDGTLQAEIIRDGALRTVTLKRPGEGRFGMAAVVAPVLEVR